MIDGPFDAIVIGSGFGGAVTALRLAEKKKRVIILERGQQFPIDNRNFPDSFAAVHDRGVWNERQAKHGIVEYREYPQVDIIQSAGVGGGSLHYFNVSIRAPDSTFEDPKWPHDITGSSLAPFYETAETMIGGRRIVPSSVQPELPARTGAFFGAMSNVDTTNLEHVRLAVNFGQRPDSTEEEICDYRGDCLIGCNINAKNTLDLKYLKQATNRGAEIWPLCKATVIKQNDDQSYTVEFIRLDAKKVDKVSAPVVVVSAGALGSTELLLRSKLQHGTLPNIPDALGKHFSTNGDLLYAGTLLPRGTVVQPMHGPSVTAGAEFRADHDPLDQQRLLVEDLGITDVLRIFLRKTIIGRGNFLQHLQRYLQGDLALTPSLRAQARGWSPLIDRFLPYLVMGKDTANGSIRLDRADDWNVVVDWPYRENLPLYTRMNELLERISIAAGGSFKKNIWDLNNKAFTAHPLGGCVMGDLENESVVDINGQVRGYPNLFVADGSIIPTSLGANPSLTITALSEWIAARI